MGGTQQILDSSRYGRYPVCTDMETGAEETGILNLDLDRGSGDRWWTDRFDFSLMRCLIEIEGKCVQPYIFSVFDGLHGSLLPDILWVGHTNAWTIPGTEEFKPYIDKKDTNGQWGRQELS